MDALVSHQVCLAAEALAALRAGEGAGAGVHSAGGSPVS